MYLFLFVGLLIAASASHIVRIFTQQPGYFAADWKLIMFFYAVAIVTGAVLYGIVTAITRYTRRDLTAGTVGLLLLLNAALYARMALSADTFNYQALASLALLCGGGAYWYRSVERFKKLVMPLAITLVASSVLADAMEMSRYTSRRSASRVDHVAVQSRTSNSVAVDSITAEGRPKHIFLIWFDAWPGEDLLENKELAAVHFRHHVPEGAYYTHAYSNAHYTYVALMQFRTGLFDGWPMDATREILRQKDLGEELAESGYRYHEYRHRHPCSSLSSVCVDGPWTFRNVVFKGRALGYFFFNTGILVEAYAQRMKLAQVWGRYLRGPFARVTWAIERSSKTERVDADINDAVLDKRLSVAIDKADLLAALLNKVKADFYNEKEPSFNFVHLILPHEPFLYDEECRFVGNALELEKPHEDAPESYAKMMYQKQSVCANKVARELIDEMKTAGIYDESLVIITSDHGLGRGLFDESAVKTADFDRSLEERFRIPLWIKWPHMKVRNEVAEIALWLDVQKTIRGAAGLKEGEQDVRGLDLQTSDLSRVGLREVTAATHDPIHGSLALRYVHRSRDGHWREITAAEAQAMAAKNFVVSAETRSSAQKGQWK